MLEVVVVLAKSLAALVVLEEVVLVRHLELQLLEQQIQVVEEEETTEAHQALAAAV